MASFFKKSCNVCNRSFQTFFDDETVTTFTLDTIQGKVHYVYEKKQWISWICENLNLNENLGDEIVVFKKGSDEDEGHFNVDSTNDRNYETDVVKRGNLKNMGVEVLNVVADYAEVEESIAKEDDEMNNSLNNSVVEFVSVHATGVKCSKTSNVKELILKDDDSDSLKERCLIEDSEEDTEAILDSNLPVTFYEKEKNFIDAKNEVAKYCRVIESSLELDDSQYYMDDDNPQFDSENENVLSDIEYERFENDIEDSDEIDGNYPEDETRKKYLEDVNNYYKNGTNSNSSNDEEKELQSTDWLLKDENTVINQEIKPCFKRHNTCQPMTVANLEMYLSQKRETKKRWFFQGLPYVSKSI